MIAASGKKGHDPLKKGVTPLSDALLTSLACLIQDHAGLHYPREKWNDLQRQIAAAAPQLGFKDLQSCAAWLLEATPSQEQMDILVSHLTIGETFFFRDKAVFRLLREQILPAWLHAEQGGGRTLRIWSAACCTGEEPYSVAMLLDQMAEHWQGWSMEILATDINRRFLERARDGVYTQWSLRDTPAELISHYFTPAGGNRCEIAQRIKRMVRFLPFNLAAPHAEGLPPGAAPCHLIFCRNVLLYLSPETINRVVGRLTDALINGGWLIVSPSETAFVRSPQLSAVHFPDAVLHRKDFATAHDTYATTHFAAAVAQRIEPTARRDHSPPIRKVFHGNSDSASTALSRKKPNEHPERSHQRRRPAEQDEERLTARNTMLKQASVAQENGRDDAALKILEELLRQAKGQLDSAFDCQAMLLLARSLANLGRLSEARQCCAKAVDGAKLQPEAHYLLATIYHELDMERESLDALKRTVYLDPRFVMAYVAMANMARLQGKQNEAARHFASALALLEGMEPKDPVPHSDGMTAQGLKEALASMMK